MKNHTIISILDEAPLFNALYWIKLTLSCERGIKMKGTRHEEYQNFQSNLPFVLFSNLQRSTYNQSNESNWHENLEIQLCTSGKGVVLLDGQNYNFNKNDIVIVNSNVIHHTGTDTNLTYSCLIVSNEFCKNIGIDTRNYIFSPVIKSSYLVELLEELQKIYSNHTTPFRIAKLNEIIIKILINLAEHHIVATITSKSKPKDFEIVKSAISYIRKNYNKKISLDQISKEVLCDKYALCRGFKRLTGQTIFENLNSYRCIKAVELLNDGQTVAQTAALCGFENLSFFTKTFKKYIGTPPSKHKK